MYETASARWRATAERDPASDNHFVYAVKTTHIFCRPVCKARLARRSNVCFYDSPEQALAAGFQACKRCHPLLDSFEPQRDLMVRICQRLTLSCKSGESVSLDALAKEAGLSKSHFHRTFCKVIGCTPREWASAEAWKDASGVLTWRGRNIRVQDASKPRDGPAEEKRSTVIYRTEVTMYGTLLVAVQQGRVCRLDLAPSEKELLSNLESDDQIAGKEWSLAQASCDDVTMRNITMQVVEALERPSGRVLYLPMSQSVVERIQEATRYLLQAHPKRNAIS